MPKKVKKETKLFRHTTKTETQTNLAPLPKTTSEWHLFLLSGVLIALVLANLLVGILSPTFGPKALATMALPSPAPIPVTNTPIPPESAMAIAILDVNSLRPLYLKNGKLRLSPASTTKLMTVLTALDYYSLDQVLTISSPSVDGSGVKLSEGSQFTVKDLITATLVASANDSAVALADGFPGGSESFVWLMNQKAKEYHLTNTHFTNPVGFDDPNHFSTVSDLARLALVAARNQTISQTVALKKTFITERLSGKPIGLTTTNSLLGQTPGVIGIKTGLTENAGECLITLVNRANHPIIIVVLGSLDRFGETEKLIDWVYSTTSWFTPSSYP